MHERTEHEESVLELRREVLFEMLNRDLRLTREAREKAQKVAHLALAIGVNAISYTQQR